MARGWAAAALGICPVFGAYSQFTAAAAGSALCTICYYLLLPLAPLPFDSRWVPPVGGALSLSFLSLFTPLAPAAGLALPQEVTAWPVTALYSAIQASASGGPLCRQAKVGPKEERGNTLGSSRGVGNCGLQGSIV